ncbi:hypothetical protein AAMO2058_000394700 [Amorphochlora amoebiformis]
MAASRTGVSPWLLASSIWIVSSESLHTGSRRISPLGRRALVHALPTPGKLRRSQLATPPTALTPRHDLADIRSREMLRRRPGRSLGVLRSMASEAEKGTAMEAKPMSHTMATVKEQLRLFWEMSIPYFKEDNGAKVMLATVIGLTLLQSGVSVVFSFVGRDFWSALNTRDVSGFGTVVSRFGVALLAGVPVSVFYRFQREKLSLKWREWMTNRVLALYTANRAYYALSSQNTNSTQGFDNPDQRIAEDVRSFCTVSLAFFITVLTSAIDLVSFSAILWSIYPQLFVAIVTYAAVGTVITAKIGKKLAALNFEQLQREADFRYSLMRLRENAESIAFYGGEDQERNEAKLRLKSLTANIAEIIRQQRNLEFFTTSYRYLIQILPGTIVAPLYFKGAVQLGSVSQSYSAFNHILSDLSLIVNQFEDLARFGAGIDRLGEFVEALRNEDQEAVKRALTRMREEQALEEKKSSGENGGMESAPSTTSLLAMPLAVNQTLMQGVAETLPWMGGGVITNPGIDTTLHRADSSRVKGGSQGKVARLAEEDTAKALKELDTLVSSNGQMDESLIRIREFPEHGELGAALRLDDFSLVTPDRRRQLVTGLNLRIEMGSKMLIAGESGTGKSSLLRAMAGLWRAGSGTVSRPPQNEIFFLPQKPYCTLGSLRDQLKYPGTLRWEKSRAKRLKDKYASEDDELLDILNKVRLGNLATKWAPGCKGSADCDSAKGLDVVQDWSSILSLGEQQRLAFGRLLYACPSLAILDEATSALDLETEKAMYRAMEERVPGISVVSVGHRPSLKAYHDNMLRLRTDGDWEITPLGQEVKSVELM